MKKIFYFILVTTFIFQTVAAQQRITSKELNILKKNLSNSPLLSDNDADFTNTASNAKWPDESAVILAQKTSFDFDQKSLSVGKRIGRNIWGLILAVPTLGGSIYMANQNNDTKMLVEEQERRKILLQDKFAIEQFSVLYFRLSTEGDAFAARVIKRDGTVQEVDASEAVRVSDVSTIPSLFRSYTDEKYTATYRPDFFKIAIPDLQEGDIIEYEFINFNTQQYDNNPNYKEFNPVYYLCNRFYPIQKQVIEVSTEDDRYYVLHKSLKGAPEFEQTNSSGKKVYRWTDNNRDASKEVRFVNEYLELPSVKFQVIYARNNSKNLVWFKDDPDAKKDLDIAQLGEKARLFWFQPQKLQNTRDYLEGLNAGIYGTSKNIRKAIKKKGIDEMSDDEYVRKVYYTIRSNTLYNNWSDFAFAKVFSSLLADKKIGHDIIVTASNQKTAIKNVAFSKELCWLIRYKNKYYANPYEHGNPEELPMHLCGNEAVSFNSANENGKITDEIISPSDTTDNTSAVVMNVAYDINNKKILTINKTTDLKGLVKDDAIDNILALTPFMEKDFMNYDGAGMWEGLSAKDEEKAFTDFNQQKKEWKEEKPKMMKAMAENEYGFEVESYKNFRIVQDGRSYKKKSLKYTENFVLSDVTATAGNDIVIALPALVGGQTKAKKEEETRTLPADVRYPRTLSWTINFAIPAGYTLKGIERLNRNINNDAGSFNSTTTVANSVLTIHVTKVYSKKNLEPQQWPLLLDILNAAYTFSQSKLVLKKA